MSLLSRAYALLLVSTKSEEHLLIDARKLARDLYSADVVSEKLETAKKFSKGHGCESRWRTWNWLIDTHRSARRQARLLDLHSRAIPPCRRRGNKDIASP